MKQYYTYDDVLIKPRYSKVLSRKNTCLKTYISDKVCLNVPIISSNMDTITEDDMAIAMAKAGGLGIIHRYCSIDKQVDMVKRVKRYTNYVIYDPYKVTPDTPIISCNTNHSLLVTDDDDRLLGIFTHRDLLGVHKDRISDPISKFMTPISKMVTIDHEIFNTMDVSDIMYLLTSNRIEKLPIIKDGKLYGLVTLKDMMARKIDDNKYATDGKWKLLVGAAVGVGKDYMERTDALIAAGCDVICVDIAHGHHILCGTAVDTIRKRYPDITIIAGNVCTAEGVSYLASRGANCVKVGIGPGSICITRKQTGCGAPQLSAVMECAACARELGVSIIADGGHNGTIGNIFKALCAGASASMLGGMLSGTLETPGQIYTKLDKKVKQIRGMAGLMSNYAKSSKMGEDTSHLEQVTPEGVEGYVTYKGPVADIIRQIEGGLRSGLSYVGCHSISELRDVDIEFVKITNSGLRESGPHGITMI